VREPFVSMAVSMRRGVSHWRIVRRMDVLVVGIMDVRVIVVHRFVLMRMLVPFCQV
jgi:hypothetical protein